jgi:hypothetical protein
MTVTYKTGDRVKFLNDTGGGVISRIDPGGYAYVQTEEGFEIPVPLKELVLSGEADNQALLPGASVIPEDAGKVAAKATKDRLPLYPENVPEGSQANIILGFVPEDKGPVFGSKLECYLVNDSDFAGYYMLGTFEGGRYYFLASGFIEAAMKIYVKTFEHAALSKISGIHLQLIFVSKGRYHRKVPLDYVIDLHAVNFSRDIYYIENEYFEQKALLFAIKDDVSGISFEKIQANISVAQQKDFQKDKPEKQEMKKEAAADTLEIDLHMDENEFKGQYTPASILSLQMSRFHAAMDEAISKKMRRLVIIHGVGQGTLKYQIRKELQEKYPDCIFQDASFREYGFGATLVHLTADKRQ